MSSYYQLVWRENELESYPTDKLNFIFYILVESNGKKLLKNTKI